MKRKPKRGKRSQLRRDGHKREEKKPGALRPLGSSLVLGLGRRLLPPASPNSPMTFCHGGEGPEDKRRRRKAGGRRGRTAERAQKRRDGNTGGFGIERDGTCHVVLDLRGKRSGGSRSRQGAPGSRRRRSTDGLCRGVPARAPQFVSLRDTVGGGFASSRGYPSVVHAPSGGPCDASEWGWE